MGEGGRERGREWEGEGERGREREGGERRGRGERERDIFTPAATSLNIINPTFTNV